jgi:hypothetical protein
MSQIRTQLCYSLDEAAQTLNLSETVLVRLSQYFKVPASAYEEVGYLSFKGDLVFSEPDLVFFRQVKECLVAGDTLEQARQKVRQGPPQAISTPHSSTVSAPTAAALREVQDSAPYQKAAERDFARYKSAHHNGISRVFEKMVKEVSAPLSKKASMPDAKPMRNKTGKENPLQSERLLPFVRNNPKWRDSSRENASKAAAPRTLGQVSAWTPAAEKDMGWERLIQDAVQRPRVLNQHLKSAALVLREQAIHRHRQTRP